MNELFLKRMKAYLNEEYEAYEETLQQPLYRGLRINTSKIDVDAFQELKICKTRPSQICTTSFYVEEDTAGLGNHPAHMAGLFYMQEPSASSAVEVLDVQKGDWVLDLCAAPGGKSTQIADRLQHTGFLVSNEIDHKRAQILLSNMERLGFSECMITNAHPEDLCHEMAGCFDRILVDAPCSGEGMFKKHSKAMDDWSEEHVAACAQRQKHILDSAYMALKQNGILVYSTCTYSMEENEETVYAFLQKYPDMELLDAGVKFGRAGFPYKDMPCEFMRRILPMDEGEGHFVAKMVKRGSANSARLHEVTDMVLPSFVNEFLIQQIGRIPAHHIQLQDKIFLKKTPFIRLKKVRILRQGTLLGEVVKNRLEPHQHFYTSSVYENAYCAVYDMNDEECISYLKGNLLSVSGYKGFVQLTWRKHPIAFSKGDGLVLKNRYPKGMRLKGL